MHPQTSLAGIGKGYVNGHAESAILVKPTPTDRGANHTGRDEAGSVKSLPRLIDEVQLLSSFDLHVSHAFLLDFSGRLQ
jgi:hypothetical protein